MSRSQLAALSSHRGLHCEPATSVFDLVAALIDDILGQGVSQSDRVEMLEQRGVQGGVKLTEGLEDVIDDIAGSDERKAMQDMGEETR